MAVNMQVWKWCHHFYCHQIFASVQLISDILHPKSEMLKWFNYTGTFMQFISLTSYSTHAHVVVVMMDSLSINPCTNRL